MLCELVHLHLVIYFTGHLRALSELCGVNHNELGSDNNERVQDGIRRKTFRPAPPMSRRQPGQPLSKVMLARWLAQRLWPKKPWTD